MAFGTLILNRVLCVALETEEDRMTASAKGLPTRLAKEMSEEWKLIRMNRGLSEELQAKSARLQEVGDKDAQMANIN